MDKQLQQKVKNWLQEIFEDPKLKINSIDYNHSAEGYVAEILFVNVTSQNNDDIKQYDLVVKKGIEDNNMQVLFPDAYINEIEVYSIFIPYLKQFEKRKGITPFDQIPFCYGTILRDHVIIMDNLKVKGFRIHDLKKPLDVNHIELVLKAYAEFHALSLALRDQEPKKMDEFRTNWKGREETKLFKCLLAVFQKELRFSIELYEQRKKELDNKSHVIEKLLLLEECYGDLLNNSLRNKDENYWVLSHIDGWNNNYLFNYDEYTKRPNKVAILDWQFAVFISPLIDVTAVLFFCGSRKELEHVDHLLKFYYDSLSAKLRELGSDPEKCFPWEVCLRSFKRYVPLAIAGMPVCVKLRCGMENVTETEDIEHDEFSINGLCEGKLTDPEEFFRKINEIFEFSIEKGYIRIYNQDNEI